MRFRKKPVEIYAVQWTGLNLDECIEFLGESFNGHFHLNRLMIGTLEGEHTASKGDWLIRGVKGEHYPCKPDIFEATYEAVE
jgi:hypothetical protein